MGRGGPPLLRLARLCLSRASPEPGHTPLRGTLSSGDLTGRSGNRVLGLSPLGPGASLLSLLVAGGNRPPVRVLETTPVDPGALAN